MTLLVWDAVRGETASDPFDTHRVYDSDSESDYESESESESESLMIVNIAVCSV